MSGHFFDGGIRQGGCFEQRHTSLAGFHCTQLLHLAASKSTWDWVLHCLTLYADICAHDTEDDCIGLRRLGILLDGIEDVKLELNVEKTVAILRVKGKRSTLETDPRGIVGTMKHALISRGACV